MRILKLFPLGLILFSHVVSATPQDLRFSVRHYEYLSTNGADGFLMTLKGMLDAFGTANAVLVVRGQAPLYCEPDSLVLTHENAAQILASEMKVTRRIPNAPLSLVLLDGLKRTFPCSTK